MLSPWLDGWEIWPVIKSRKDLRYQCPNYQLILYILWKISWRVIYTSILCSRLLKYLRYIANCKMGLQVINSLKFLTFLGLKITTWSDCCSNRYSSWLFFLLYLVYVLATVVIRRILPLRAASLVPRILAYPGTFSSIMLPFSS
jgi:hypothetical protein